MDIVSYGSDTESIGRKLIGKVLNDWTRTSKKMFRKINNIYLKLKLNSSVNNLWCDASNYLLFLRDKRSDPMASEI